MAEYKHAEPSHLLHPISAVILLQDEGGTFSASLDEPFSDWHQTIFTACVDVQITPLQKCRLPA